MSDFGQPGQPGQPTEEQLRAALDQLRASPVDVVIADVLNALLQGAQVKLGRRDARVLLDLIDTVARQIEPYVDARLSSEVANAISQLKMAQVQAEQEVAAGPAEPNDLPADGSAPPSPAGEGQPQPSAQPPQQGGQASRLWVPGR